MVEIQEELNEQELQLVEEESEKTRSFEQDYEVLEFIGKGAQMAVHKVREKKTGEVYVAKTPHHPTPKEVEQLERDCRALKSLNHPGIERYHDFYSWDNLMWKTWEFVLVTEYVKGKSLAQLLQDGRRFSEEELRSIKEQSLDALAAAHEKGIVHRDIKPSNMLLEEGTDNVKITDFGIAKFLGDRTRLTASLGVGSICYMAPEQIKGERVSPATDYYSLGLTLIALAAGEERTDDIRNQDPLKTLNKLTHLSAGFRKSLELMVNDDPEKRAEGLESEVYILANKGHKSLDGMKANGVVGGIFSGYGVGSVLTLASVPLYEAGTTLGFYMPFIIIVPCVAAGMLIGRALAVRKYKRQQALAAAEEQKQLPEAEQPNALSAESYTRKLKKIKKIAKQGNGNLEAAIQEAMGLAAQAGISVNPNDYDKLRIKYKTNRKKRNKAAIKLIKKQIRFDYEALEESGFDTKFRNSYIKQARDICQAHDIEFGGELESWVRKYYFERPAAHYIEKEVNEIAASSQRGFWKPETTQYALSKLRTLAGEAGVPWDGEREKRIMRVTKAKLPIYIKKELDEHERYAQQGSWDIETIQYALSELKKLARQNSIPWNYGREKIILDTMYEKQRR